MGGVTTAFQTREGLQVCDGTKTHCCDCKAHTFRCLSGGWKRGPRSSAGFLGKTCREQSALEILSRNGFLGDRKYQTPFLLDVFILECSGNTTLQQSGLFSVSR